MKTVHAIWERGVFRPLEAIDLPEQTKVEFEPRPLDDSEASLEKIYDILGEKYASGQADVAACHNEHQP